MVYAYVNCLIFAFLDHKQGQKEEEIYEWDSADKPAGKAEGSIKSGASETDSTMKSTAPITKTLIKSLVKLACFEHSYNIPIKRCEHSSSVLYILYWSVTAFAVKHETPTQINTSFSSVTLRCVGIELA